MLVIAKATCGIHLQAVFRGVVDNCPLALLCNAQDVLDQACEREVALQRQAKIRVTTDGWQLLSLTVHRGDVDTSLSGWMQSSGVHVSRFSGPSRIRIRH